MCCGSTNGWPITTPIFPGWPNSSCQAAAALRHRRMSAAQAHVCRTVARRAERSIVALGRAETIGEAPRQYVNRLSDLLFVLARVLNRADGGTDVLWKRDEHKPT